MAHELTLKDSPMHCTTMKLTSLLLAASLLAGCTAPGMIASAGLGVGTAAAQERGIGGAADDAAIRAEINHLYLQKDLNDLYKNISIDVMEGRVMLTGSVNKPETVNEAVKLAWRPAGVKEVINEIEAVGAEGVQDYALDTYISGAIASRLLLERNIRSLNYTVETVNQKAYILGIARDQEELQRVAHIASTTKYVKEVITHVIMQSDPRRGDKANKPYEPTGGTDNTPRSAPVQSYDAQPADQQFYDSYDSGRSMTSGSTGVYDPSYSSGGAVKSGSIGSTELAPLR
jgi:osmotically-inducible protein OsmY